MLGLNEYRDMIFAGYPRAIDCKDPSRVENEPIVPQAAFIDAGYMTETVYQFCRTNQGVLPSVGRGATQQPRPGHQQATSGQSITRKVGEGYRTNWQKAQRILLAEVNADHWKSWVHARLETPLDQPGSMNLFQLRPPRTP